MTFSLYVKYLYFGRKMEIISVTIWYMMHDQPLCHISRKKLMYTKEFPEDIIVIYDGLDVTSFPFAC